MMKLLILGFVAVAAAEFTAPTATQVSDIQTAISTELKSDRDYIPMLVRLAFHDCVGNACDGCINLDNGSNDGLSDVITWLDTLYVGVYDSIVSRADFWQIAAIAAIERAVSLNNAACSDSDTSCTMSDSGITFKWGRDDCSTSPSTSETHDFPEPTMSRTDMMDYFNGLFGFSEDEVTALMGAHTLGGAERVNSGYVGVWVSGEKNFWNNNFYSLLTSSDSVFTSQRKAGASTTDKKFQWGLADTSGTNLGFMLNTDVELVYDIDVSATAGTSCTIATDCAEASTKSLAETYASDSATWIADFKTVYEKMIEHGYTDLAGVV